MTEQAKRSEELPEPVKDRLVIRGNEIPITIQFLHEKSLSFYLENPRVYSVVRAENEEPSQDDIEAELRQRDHVRRLKMEIESNGGLIDAVIVRGTTREVVEGNSRLAAYRILAETDPIKWAYMKCNVLP